MPDTLFVSKISTAACPTVLQGPSAQGKGQWSFNSTRDERAYGLTAEQCDVAFPGLFTEIDRAVEYRRKVGNITPEDVDISWKDKCAVRAVILDQQVGLLTHLSFPSLVKSTQAELFLRAQLYVLEAKFSDTGCGYANSRGLSLLHAIHRAIITSPSPLPNIEFSFTTSDIADPLHLQHSIWALSRTEDEEETWLIPDFGYWSWPNSLIGGYEQIRREIADSEINFADKKRQVVWRGVSGTNSLRKDLLRVTANKEWADVQDIEWANSTAVDQVTSGAIAIPEHCQYQFVIQTEGK
jgi:hypothetical protein